MPPSATPPDPTRLPPTSDGPCNVPADPSVACCFFHMGKEVPRHRGLGVGHRCTPASTRDTQEVLRCTWQ